MDADGGWWEITFIGSCQAGTGSNQGFMRIQWRVICSNSVSCSKDYLQGTNFFFFVSFLNDSFDMCDSMMNDFVKYYL